ncbi:Copper chaperone CopZ [Natronincola peptidivorans]|uniref:Copper chaperone CopZ n=1 Tax=Natronincola peptidivorans TaxID=426128 RepID=A0A1I0CXH5_9FIRM|nr:cation transporter [Natronincola peptidivorans]SET24563.1 Copper chaperone CopZ [Natronincola peptidivorans]
MKKKITIEGMSCGHCVAHVEKALKAIEEVIEVQVNLAEKNAIVELNGDVADAKLTEIIEDAGYDVVAIENQ